MSLRLERRSPHALLLVLAVLLVAAACSDKNGAGTDATIDGVDDAIDAVEEDDASDAPDEEVGLASPAPPEAPAPPVLTPCPDGWREVEDADTGAITCDPWPEGGRHVCAADEAHFPGEPGCTTIGTPCGSGDWATDLPTDRTVVYVLAGASSGGDGSETSPYATIAEAMDAAASGDVVALSKGTFDEAVTVGAGITLWGACTAETLLTCSVATDTSPTVMAGGSGAEVRNVTIGGQRPGVANMAAGRTMTLDGVIIRDARNVGIQNAGSMSLHDTAIRGTGRAFTVVDQGFGLAVIDGGSAEMSRVAVEGNRAGGILVMGTGATITASDIVSQGNMPTEESTDFGYGMIFQDGGEGHVERVWIEGNYCAGIHVVNDGFLRASDIVVRDSNPCYVGRTLGRGIMVEVGSSLELSRAHVASNLDVGISVTTASEADLSDVVITGTQANISDSTNGMGIAAADASGLLVQRAILVDNHGAGISVTGAGSTADLVDVSVWRTYISSLHAFACASGIWIISGATVNVTRAHLQENVRVGLRVNGSGASATVTDLTILNSRGIPFFNSGFGVWVFGGAEASITRSLIEGNRDLGVSAEGAGTVLTLVDAMVKDTRSQDGSGRWGRGIQVLHGAHVDLTRTVFEHNRGLGLAAVHPGTQIIGTDVAIRDTIEEECATSTCEGRGHGCGISVHGEAHLDLTSFLVTGNALCGVQICYGADDETGLPFTIGGSVDLHDGSVSDNPIGVNVQTGDYDLDRLQDNVLFFDNDTNLDSYDLPVPDMASSG